MKTKHISLLLLIVFTFLPQSLLSQSKTIEYCDSIIKQGIEELINKNYSTSLELLTDAKLMAEKNSWNRQLFLAVNNIGVIYSELLNYGDALEFFLEAYKIALKGSDSKNEMNAMINIAIMYYKEGKTDKAVEYLKKVYQDAKTLNDTQIMGLCTTNLAIIYNKTGKVEEAEEYLKMSFKLFENFEIGLTYVKVTAIENAFLNNNIAEAKRMAEEILPSLQGKQNFEHRISIYMVLSGIYDQMGNSKKAIEFINLALADNPTIINLIDIYTELSKIYAKEKVYDKALVYKDSIMYAKDSLNKVTNLLHFENNKIRFEMANYQKDLEHNKALRTNERIIFISLLALAIILIWAVYNSFAREKQKKQLAEWNQKVIALELEKEKNDKVLLEKQLIEKEEQVLQEQSRFDVEQGALRNEIEAKNRELIAKAMSFSTKNELINDLYSLIEGLADSEKKQDILRSIKALQGEADTESELGDFFLYFEEVNQDFINSLKDKHANLTPNDIRFLSYVYIGLNTKEISSLLNITIDSCKKRKMRVAKKMGLQGGAPALYDYLSNIK